KRHGNGVVHEQAAQPRLRVARRSDHRSQCASARRVAECFDRSISLIPFIISSGTGAEIEKPLAIVVVGGLVTRPIKIVILPMVYEWVERRAARRAEVAKATATE